MKSLLSFPVRTVLTGHFTVLGIKTREVGGAVQTTFKGKSKFPQVYRHMPLAQGLRKAKDFLRQKAAKLFSFTLTNM